MVWAPASERAFVASLVPVAEVLAQPRTDSFDTSNRLLSATHDDANNWFYSPFPTNWVCNFISVISRFYLVWQFGKERKDLSVKRDPDRASEREQIRVNKLLQWVADSLKQVVHSCLLAFARFAWIRLRTLAQDRSIFINTLVTAHHWCANTRVELRSLLHR